MNDAMHRFDRKNDARHRVMLGVKVIAAMLWFLIFAVFWDAST